ncbi:unnamed protein product [Oncorhynchus mykiss]|uniref:Uncharacterized protein n=1 Tax=Oncorhynchus mykiss TaxID=8022 RepID=A0A060WGA7_ONCMY|nr:unnamed protein product [Oncorhynchus mykiss]
MERRRSFSAWLSHSATQRIEQEVGLNQGGGNVEAIFSYLTGHRISDACRLAQKSGDHRLSLLLSQAVGSQYGRELLALQLGDWNRMQTDSFLPEERLRIFALLAGKPVWQSTDCVVNVCSELDWKRSMAVHLWYMLPPTASIAEALVKYEAAFQGSAEGQKYACAPLPPYLDQSDQPDMEEEESKRPLYDICFHLLKLYSDRHYSLQQLLDPLAVTWDRLDYRLSWHLWLVLQALHYTHLSPARQGLIHTSYAAQLESAGLWDMAIYVLLHIPDNALRERAVREMLQLHCPLLETEESAKKEHFLTERLLVPEQWLHQAKATRARRERDSHGEALHLYRAGHWNLCHSLVIQHLASDCIINDNHEYLLKFLEGLAVPERSAVIQDWDTAGRVYLDYIGVVQTLHAIQQMDITGYELECLHTEVRSLCNRIELLPCSTAKDRLSQSEMAKRVANILRVVLSLQQGGEGGEIPLSQLASNIGRLPMPEDYALEELRMCLGAHGRYAQKLLTDLFANYTNALRPVEDTDHIINVTLQITLSQIIDMDERNQILTTYLWIRMVWTDAYLTWKKEDYDGLDTIRIPSSYVWRPDIVLYNNADDQFSSSMETNVVIRNDGQIMWDQPAISKSSCSVDVSFFPFDAQQCRLTFGSWTHNGNQMDLVNALDSADLADFVANVEWEVLGMPAKKNVILYGCCSDPYPDITYTLHLKRRASFYIFNLLIPCMMISFLAPLGFYLPADSGEKVSLGVTVLLALTVFQLLVAESMPPSENVPLIGEGLGGSCCTKLCWFVIHEIDCIADHYFSTGKYYIATMTMITASTALTIFIMNIHHCGPEARPVPEWARRFILHYLARICFVFEVGENCFTGTPKKQAPPEPPPDHNINPLTRGTNWDVNGQAWGGMEGRGEEEVGGKEEGNRLDVKKGSYQMFEPSRWKDDLFVKRGCVEGGGAEDRGRREVVVSVQCVCQHQALRRNIEYIASCYHDQRSTQRRTGEWRKVAKVMDRLFMWLFFIMVFLMSLLIMGKAV